MDFYTTIETANELDVSPRTIERWRKTGVFVPASRTAGGHSRYSIEQVELAKKGTFSVPHISSLRNATVYKINKEDLLS